MKVWIYCGVSGAGKTTLIRERHKGAVVVSADDFFVGADGEYKFDPALIGEAHAQCLRTFVDQISFRGKDIVVDNTNTSVAELAPYAALALAFGHELQIVTLFCDPYDAYTRNEHSVPLDVVLRMHEQLASRQMPPWWPHDELTPGGQCV